MKICQLKMQAGPWSSRRDHLPILLHLGKQLVLHVSETQTAEQGGQDGALGDTLALDIAPGGGGGSGSEDAAIVGFTLAFDTHTAPPPPAWCIHMYTDIRE